ncbi:MAG: hypothetical protein M5U15_11075 [Kiritimatiellae bacterium]|nr:hypothetical protein [Kiritimatiellia bacterium]
MCRLIHPSAGQHAHGHPAILGQGAKGIRQFLMAQIEHGDIHALLGGFDFAKDQGHRIAARRKGDRDLLSRPGNRRDKEKDGKRQAPINISHPSADG